MQKSCPDHRSRPRSLIPRITIPVYRPVCQYACTSHFRFCLLKRTHTVSTASFLQSALLSTILLQRIFLHVTPTTDHRQLPAAKMGSGQSVQRQTRRKDAAASAIELQTMPDRPVETIARAPYETIPRSNSPTMYYYTPLVPRSLSPLATDPALSPPSPPTPAITRPATPPGLNRLSQIIDPDDLILPLRGDPVYGVDPRPSPGVSNRATPRPSKTPSEVRRARQALTPSNLRHASTPSYARAGAVEEAGPTMVESPSGNLLKVEEYLRHPDRPLTVRERRERIVGETRAKFGDLEAGGGGRSGAFGASQGGVEGPTGQQSLWASLFCCGSRRR